MGSTTPYTKTHRLALVALALLAASAPATAATARAWLVRMDAGTFHLVVACTTPHAGGEVGFAWNEADATFLGAERGSEFPADDGEIRLDADPANACRAAPEFTAGFVAGWRYSEDAMTTMDAGIHEVLVLRFAPKDGGGDFDAFLPEPVRCLGPVEAPIRNIVTDPTGESVPLLFEQPRSGIPFVRGDVNDDGTVNIADVVRLLTYLYVEGAPIGCPAAGDIDDSGSLNVTDPVLLLRYLFSEGRPPSYPFPSCGVDPTYTGTLECNSFASCT